jgi:DNA-binding CsgD family transcriptional regulator
LALASRTDVAQLASVATLAARNLESAYERAKVELGIGRAMARLGAREPALAHLMAAQDLFEESGAQAWVVLVGVEGERAGQDAGALIAAPRARQADVLLTLSPATAVSESAGEGSPVRDESWAQKLTARELEVAQLVAQGLPNREVAAQLYCSVRTVEVHLGRVYRKLELRSRFELVVLAHRADSTI